MEFSRRWTNILNNIELYQSCFETRTGNRKLFPKVELGKIMLFLTKYFENENFRYALSHVI